MTKYFYEKLEGWPAVAIVAILLGGVAYYAWFSYGKLEEEKALVLARLDESHERSYQLVKLVMEKDAVIDSFEGQISELSGTVGTLEKLTQTDEELLKKYSKIYFLNENYVPPTLADIDEKYLLSGSKNFMIYAKVWPYLRNLLEAARRDGHDLLVASAFRSFESQSALKSAYTVIYGAGANKFSADQGYSEHQLGTAVDFTNSRLGANFSAFGKDEAYRWLRDHAHEYGFILSYPEGNAYYKFEPWHWRFIGVELATKLKEEGKHFYDLDQREIDKYLVNLFD